jgi:hypothetical protein
LLSSSSSAVGGFSSPPFSRSVTASSYSHERTGDVPGAVRRRWRYDRTHVEQCGRTASHFCSSVRWGHIPFTRSGSRHTSFLRRQARHAWLRRSTPATSLGWPTGWPKTAPDEANVGVGCTADAVSTWMVPCISGRLTMSTGTGIVLF